METKTKSETLPTKDSVLKKEPMPVIEVPSKKVVLAKEKSSQKTEDETQQKQTEMEVDSHSEDVISPSNQT